MFSGLSTALGSHKGSNFLYAGGNLVSGTSLDIESSNSGGLTINNALNAGTGKFILNAKGLVAENATGKITTSLLTGSSHGTVTLNAANAITNLGAFITNNGSFSLTDAHALTVTGAVNAGTGTLTLKTTSGNLTIKALMTAAATTLISAAQALESGAGAIHATTLNVTAQTGINLSGPNVITTIGTNHTTSGTDIINH
jgi:hypothetical protein